MYSRECDYYDFDLADGFLLLSLLLDLYFSLYFYFFDARYDKNEPLRCLGSFLSSGLHPKHPHILHPEDGSFVFLTSYGT